ncbi:MAG: DUF4124 domain-containing protein [Pseudomonadota bacterium]
MGSMILAAVALAALFSMRADRNLFAEGAGKAGDAVSKSAAGGVIDSARSAMKGREGQIRSCVIKGKTVISNTACTEQNKTSKVIEIHDSRGFDAPKKPDKPAVDPSIELMREKMIEKQLQ